MTRRMEIIKLDFLKQFRWVVRNQCHFQLFVSFCELILLWKSFVKRRRHINSTLFPAYVLSLFHVPNNDPVKINFSCCNFFFCCFCAYYRHLSSVARDNFELMSMHSIPFPSMKTMPKKIPSGFCFVQKTFVSSSSF